MNYKVQLFLACSRELAAATALRIFCNAERMFDEEAKGLRPGPGSTGSGRLLVDREAEKS